MTGFCELICAGLALCVASAAVTAAEEGSASGWLEQRGQRVALKYAFAVTEEDSIEGPGKERIEVLLSDKPVPPEMRKATNVWSFWAGDQARKGQMHGVILYITPDTKVWSRGQLLSPEMGLMFYFESATSPEGRDLVFAPATAGAGEIAGKVFMKKTMNELGEGGGPWRVEAEFRTAVVARPAVSGTLTGAEALNSPQYRAVQAYIQASLKKDVEAIKRAMNSNAQKMLEEAFAAGQKKELLEMFAREAAESRKLKLTKVTVRGETAEVEFVETGKDPSGKTTMRVVLEGGVWKIGQ